MLQKAFAETLVLLKMIAPKMFVGMLAASFLFSLPQFKRATDKISVLTSFANLKSGVAVLAFFANKVIALSILADMYRRKLIDRREVMIASVIGMFPLSVRAVISVLAPVAISSLGLKLGMIYCSLELTSRFIVALMGVYFGKMQLSGGYIDYAVETSLRKNVLNTIKHFLRIILILTVTIFVVSLLLNAKFFGLDAKTPQLAIILSGASSAIAGFGTAGLLLARNEIDERTAMTSLMIAMVFHRIVENLRLSLPVNVSLFGSSLGIKLTAVLLLASEVVCALNIIFLFLLIFAGIV